ncbi:MAG: V-type ATP synthase subunit E [Brevinema sp.]
MSLEDIKKKILADAEQKKQDALKVARDQATQFQAESQKEIAAYKDEHQRAAKSIAENVERGLVIDARRTLANSILAKKRNCIDNVYTAAQESFLASADYAPLMKKLIISVLQSKKEEVILSASDKALNQAWLDALNKEAGSALVFAKDKGTFAGGVILRDGEVFFNITAETLFAQIREKTEKPVADILFGR